MRVPRAFYFDFARRLINEVFWFYQSTAVDKQQIKRLLLESDTPKTKKYTPPHKGIEFK